MSDDSLQTLVELTRDSRFCMFTTVDAEGSMISRPMSRQEVDLDVEMYFIARRDSRKAAHLAANSTANVTVTTDSSWVSLSGHAEVVDDTEKLRELWNTFTEAWLPEGPESPEAVLVKFTADGAEYWDSPGGRVATVISLVKSKVTGQPYDGGDHAKLDV